MVAGTAALRHGHCQLAGADGQQQVLTRQRQSLQILQRREQGGRSHQGRAQQAQQALLLAATDRRQIAAHLAGKGMAGIDHHRVGMASGPGSGQFGPNSGLTRQGPDLDGQIVGG